MGFAKPIEQYLFGNLLIRIHGFMYLKDIIRGDDDMPATRDGKLWRSQFYYKDWQGVRRKKNKRGFKTND